MTISMLALAGCPATAGFFGKVYLIQAAIDNGYAWLAVFIVVGSAVSLAYSLRVVAAVWMRDAPAAAVRARPAMAGGSREADDADRAAGRSPGSSVPATRGDTGAVVAADYGDEGGVGRVLRQPEVVFVAGVCAIATIAFGVYPEPLLDVARDAGDAIRSLI
jgi:NADH-quinone oxidoreductase subunit N